MRSLRRALFRVEEKNTRLGNTVGSIPKFYHVIFLSAQHPTFIHTELSGSPRRIQWYISGLLPRCFDSSQTLMPATSDSGIASSSSTPRHPRHRRTSGIPIQASTAQVEGSIPLCSSGFLSRRVITCLFQTQTLTIPNPSHRTLRMGNPFCER